MVNYIVALKGAFAAASTCILFLMTKNDYERLAKATPINIDSYVGELPPAFTDRLQCVLMHWFFRWTHQIHSQPFPIMAKDHPHLKGLKRTHAIKTPKDDASEPPKTLQATNKKIDKKAPLVVGTIRKLSTVCVFLFLIRHLGFYFI